jgi:hypothetical protein
MSKVKKILFAFGLILITGVDGSDSTKIRPSLWNDPTTKINMFGLERNALMEHGEIIEHSLLARPPVAKRSAGEGNFMMG